MGDFNWRGDKAMQHTIGGAGECNDDEGGGVMWKNRADKGLVNPAEVLDLASAVCEALPSDGGETEQDIIGADDCLGLSWEKQELGERGCGYSLA